MKIRIAADITEESIVDGPGFRTVIWVQGCSHKCEGCHNPSTHDFNGGQLVDCDEFIADIIERTPMGNITFSGGDPFEQPKACAYIARKLKEQGFSIWAYSGYTYEEIIKDNNKSEFLRQVDVLVDGKFEIDKRTLDPQYRFRGSSNQRIIDVELSLINGCAISHADYMFIQREDKKKNY